MHEEKKPKVEQNSALKEIETKLVAKRTEFKQLQERERILKSQLEKTQHDIIKTAGAYNVLADLKKTLLLKEGYEQEKKINRPGKVKPIKPWPQPPKNEKGVDLSTESKPKKIKSEKKK